MLLPGDAEEPPDEPSLHWRHATAAERESVVALRALLARVDAPLLRDPMLETYGGADRAMLLYLRAGDVALDAAVAARRMRETAEFRKALGLDALRGARAVADALAAHPLYPHWPVKYVGADPETGCPRFSTDVGALQPKELVRCGDDELVRIFALSCTHALHMVIAAEEARGAPLAGTIETYDGAGFSVRVLGHWSALRRLKRTVALGAAHFPETLARAEVVRAPSLVSIVWNAVRPLLHERTKGKVRITSAAA